MIKKIIFWVIATAVCAFMLGIVLLPDLKALLAAMPAFGWLIKLLDDNYLSAVNGLFSGVHGYTLFVIFAINVIIVLNYCILSIPFALSFKVKPAKKRKGQIIKEDGKSTIVTVKE